MKAQILFHWNEDYPKILASQIRPCHANRHFHYKLRRLSNKEDRQIEDLKKYAKLQTLRGWGKGDIISEHPKTFSNKPKISLDDFYKNALQNGLEYHIENKRGFVPAGLIEEIRALAMPPIPWDVELGKWFNIYFLSLQKKRTYARPSRRQGSTPDIPRPRYLMAWKKQLEPMGKMSRRAAKKIYCRKILLTTKAI